MISFVCVRCIPGFSYGSIGGYGYCFLFCFGCVACFSGFVYAIASAACEFLYRKNNEYYEIKNKKKKRKVVVKAELTVKL